MQVDRRATRLVAQAVIVGLVWVVGVGTDRLRTSEAASRASYLPTAVPTTTPDADGWTHLAGDLVDFAPDGLPDFDQRQTGWGLNIPNHHSWTYDGPAAAANALWWLDSRHETNGEGPPTIADGHDLVHTYGAWDDHAAENAPELVAQLATRFRTDPDGGFVFGTCLADLESGLRGHLGQSTSMPRYLVRRIEQPSMAQLTAAVAAGQPVVLLVGFWQHLVLSGWRRIGGHYVTLEAVDPLIERVRIADPFRDRTSPVASGTVHNNAGQVSHDTWLVSPSLRQGTLHAVLHLDGYLDNLSDREAILGNFQSLNAHDCGVPDEVWFDNLTPEAHLDAAVILEVDLVPTATPTPSATATPSPTATATDTSSPTATPSPSSTTPPTPTIDPLATASGTPDGTAEATTAPTDPTAEIAATGTEVPEAVATSTPSPTDTPSPTPSPTASATSTPTATATQPPTPTATLAPTMAPTPSPTGTPLPTATSTASPTSTPEPTSTPLATSTPGPGDVCGQVSYKGTHVGVGLDVRLYRETRQQGRTRTAEGGGFCFFNLAPGRYRLQAVQRACPLQEMPIEVTGGIVRADLVLACHARKAFLPILVKKVRWR